MTKTKIAMNYEQWKTVIDAVNDKYPDSDCLDILINNVPYFPFDVNNSTEEDDGIKSLNFRGGN